MKKKNTIVTFTIVTFFMVQTVLAQTNLSARKKHFNLDTSLAIEGYDPVAYFTENKAIEGSKKYSYEYKSAKYRFANSKNLEKFKSDPLKYEPSYGGWCAYAMGTNGKKVEVDPTSFKIVKGKLYLFYNSLFNNTLSKWNDNEANLKKKADSKWSIIINGN